MECPVGLSSGPEHSLMLMAPCYIQPDPSEWVRNELEEYHQAKQIKLPSQVPASAGGLNKTSKKTHPLPPLT